MAAVVPALLVGFLGLYVFYQKIKTRFKQDNHKSELSVFLI